MKLWQTLRSDSRQSASVTIAPKGFNKCPANLLDLISNPPALLYSSPAMGMILCFVYAATLLYHYFTKRLSASLLRLSARRYELPEVKCLLN